MNHQKILRLPTNKFGFATSAAQSESENVVTKSGKTSNGFGLWEEYLETQKRKGNSIPGENLRRWKNSRIIDDDLKLIKETGADHFRISINPVRIMNTDGIVHSEGIEFYEEIFDSAKKYDLKLILTLHHVQRPINMDWTNPKSVDYWINVLKILLENFGDREELMGFITHCEPLNVLFVNYIAGVISPYTRSLKKAGQALNNMTKFHKKSVNTIYNRCRNSTNPMIILSHAWVPARRKLFPLIDDWVVDCWNKNWNVKHIKKMISSKTILGINTYAVQPLGILTAFIPTEWPFFFKAFKNPRPEAVRTAVEQAHEAFPKTKLAITEMGFGEPKMYDDLNRPEYLYHSFLELTKLTGKINLEFIDVWTFVDNMEWSEGDRIRFGVAKYTKGKIYLKRTGQILKKIFTNKGLI